MVAQSPEARAYDKTNDYLRDVWMKHSLRKAWVLVVFTVSYSTVYSNWSDRKQHSTVNFHRKVQCLWNREGFALGTHMYACTSWSCACWITVKCSVTVESVSLVMALISRRSWVRIPLKPWFFFRLLLSHCLNWKTYCDDHSSISSTTAVQIWIISYKLHIASLHGKIWTQ